MHKIDTPGHNNNEFTEGDPQTATSATVVGEDWLNTMQREVVHVVETNGLTLNKMNDTQLYQAISLMTNPTIGTANMAALRALPAPTQNVTRVLLGFTSVGDGGGGLFWYDPTDNRTDNGGTIIQPDLLPTNGRWVRMVFDGKLHAKWFGCLGDNSTDDSANAQKMSDACRDNPEYHTIVFDDGIYKLIDVRVWSHMRIEGGGYFYPFTVNASTPRVVAATHTGTKAVFWAEASGLDPRAGSGILRDIYFKNMTLIGLGTYTSLLTKAVWFKGDSAHTGFLRFSATDFTEQVILQERDSHSAGVCKLEELFVLGAYAESGSLSDWLGTIELRLGENVLRQVDSFAGNNQDYGTNPTDLWRTPILADHNEVNISDCRFQFGDAGAVIRAFASRISNSRVDNCFGHGWVFEQKTGEVPPEQTQVTNCLAFRIGGHADDTFDGFHVTDGDSIGGCLFDNCIVRANTADPNKHRHGFYDGGPVIGSVEWRDTPNRWRGCYSTGHQSAWWNASQATANGPEISLRTMIDAADEDATPSVEQITRLRINYGSATNITFLDDGVHNQVVKLMSTSPTPNATLIHSATFQLSNGDDHAIQQNRIYTFWFYKPGNTWYEEGRIS